MASGSYNIQTGNKYINGYVEITESNVDIANNKSTVTVVAYLHRTNNYSGDPTSLTGTLTRKITIDDTVYDGTAYGTYTIPNNKSYVEIYRASKEITHNSDGSKTVNVKFMCDNSLGLTGFKVSETSGSLALDVIPRYELLKIKINGNWKRAIPYVKINGVWRKATPYVKINGSWRKGVY